VFCGDRFLGGGFGEKFPRGKTNLDERRPAKGPIGHCHGEIVGGGLSVGGGRKRVKNIFSLLNFPALEKGKGS